MATLVVAGAAVAVVAAPTALAAQPACSVSNVRTHKDYAGLQAAVDAAKAADTLEVKGTCGGSTSIGKGLTLKGVSNRAFPGAPTLDGNQGGRVLDLTAGSTTIRNLAITNGLTSGSGGGIFVRAAADAAVFDSQIRRNTAGSNNFGGGVEVAGGSLLLVRSSVNSNAAGSSAGIDMDGATVSLVESEVLGNTATHAPSASGDGCLFGGVIYACAAGIWNFHGTLSLSDSDVASNGGAYRGGGMRTDIAVAGGSVVDGVTYLAGSSTIRDNSASDSGGGIWARARQAGVPVDPSPAFRAADGSPSYVDPLTGATLPAWTGGLSGNAPDQCAALGFSTFMLGTHTCGAGFS
jgi:hypothetical protein